MRNGRSSGFAGCGEVASTRVGVSSRLPGDVALLSSVPVSATVGDDTCGRGRRRGRGRARACSLSAPGADAAACGEPATSDPATSEPQTSEPATTDDPVESGGPPEDECVTDEDCKLHSDCCVCEGVPVDEDVGDCEKECKQPLCSEFGVTGAVCRLGVCEAQRLSCDQTKVACNEPPPVCPPGTLPETDAECWTGACVPQALCDAVPDCGFCGPEQFCVTKQGEGFFPVVCEPLPGHCGGTSSCNCVGELVCLQPFGLCFQTDTLAVSCECPNC